MNIKQKPLGKALVALLAARTDSAAQAAENNVRAAISGGADPNLPVPMKGRVDYVPVEFIVKAQGRNYIRNKARALELLMEDKALELDGTRASLEGLTPLQYSAFNATDQTGNESLAILKLLATTFRKEQMSEKIGSNTVVPQFKDQTLIDALRDPQNNYPACVEQAIGDGVRERVLAKFGGKEAWELFPAAARRPKEYTGAR